MLRTLKDFRVLNGGLAQLARAPALHAGGHRFDSDILHDFQDILRIGFETPRIQFCKIVFTAIVIMLL